MISRLFPVLVLLAAFAGCNDSDDDDDPAVFDPAPQPDPPTPDPAPDPDPEPDPDPPPTPAPAQGWVVTGNMQVSSLAAVDSFHVWAGGGDGVYRSTNGGVSWVPVWQTGVSALQFLDVNHGWAVANDLYSTSDGGLTWTVRMEATIDTGSFDHVSFLSPTTGWAMSGQTRIFKTTDGGETWTPQFLAPNANSWNVTAMKFVSANHGWVTARPGNAGLRIYRTADGGDTWAEMLRLLGDVFFFDLDAVSPTVAWAVGGRMVGEALQPMIYATTDGGTTWNEQFTGDSTELRKVHFINANTGWTVGAQVHRTVNGGATWTAQESPVQDFSDVFFVNSTHGWTTTIEWQNPHVLRTTTGGE